MLCSNLNVTHFFSCLQRTPSILSPAPMMEQSMRSTCMPCSAPQSESALTPVQITAVYMYTYVARRVLGSSTCERVSCV